jgi:hypothetical protein
MIFFQHGNKAALIVGIILMIADGAIPMAREFGAWTVGCLFCVWYSASAIREDGRIKKTLKKWLYVYLAIAFVFAVSLHDFVDIRSGGAHWSIQSSLKAVGIDAR